MKIGMYIMRINMKIILVLIGLIAIFLITPISYVSSQNGNPPQIKSNDMITFAETYGGERDDVCKSIQQTNDGGYIIAGWTYSFGSGDADVWLIKIDKNGKKMWDKTYGDKHWEEGHSVQQTSDNGYIILGMTFPPIEDGANVWLIKTDNNGNLQWDETYRQGNWADGRSVQQTNDGGYIIAGWTQPDNDLGDFLLIKTDNNGQILWKKNYGGNSSEGSSSVQQSNDGGYIIIGSTSSYGAGGFDMLMIKTDLNGNFEWNKTIGGLNDDKGASVLQTDDWGYIIVGSTESFGAGDSDAWLIKTDCNGDHIWMKTFGGKYDDSAYSVDITTDGGYIIIGMTESYGAGGSDIWLIKTDSSGNEQWNKTFGRNGNDYGFSIQVTADGGYIFAGITRPYANGIDGYSDGWIYKTDSSGNIYEKNNEPSYHLSIMIIVLIVAIIIFSIIVILIYNYRRNVKNSDNQKDYIRQDEDSLN